MALRIEQTMTNQMKLKQTVFLAIGLLPLGVIAQTNKLQSTAPPGAAVMPAKPPPAEMPEKGRLSYAIGMYFANNIANSIKRGELNVDSNTVIEGIKDVLTGKPTRLSEKELTEVMNQLKAAMLAKQSAEAEETKARSEAFLVQFARGAGVTTLSNGLEYKVIKEGDGAMPNENDTVTVAYRGTFSNGTEFDHNDNFTTPVRGRIIQGWQKILPLMKVGSKWQVAIPPSLGYGPRGMPPRIPGNSALVFDLELKSITPKAPSLPPTAAARAAAFKPTAPAPSTPVVSGEIIKVPSSDELKKGAKIEVIKAGQTNVVNPQ
jgi:FKBP-type peptidyl-prolyl cis-trans isomerase FklB